MDKSVCPQRDYIVLMDPVTGRFTWRGLLRLVANGLVAWVITVMTIAVGLMLAQLL
jgi:hypothetical protein